MANLAPNWKKAPYFMNEPRQIEHIFEKLQKGSIYRLAGKAYYEGSIGTIKIRYGMLYLIRKFDKGTPNKAVLFYPDKPRYNQTLYKICKLLGYRMTSSLQPKPDLVVAFKDTTRRLDDPILKGIAATHYVVNEHCNDVSKVKVEHVFQEIFGYGTFVDPELHQGFCVMKSDENTTHDGQVVKCPIRGKMKDAVYQKVINNTVGNDVLDLRVPIVRDKVPFVYLKYRPLSSRFSNRNARVMISSADSVFSDHDMIGILKFVQKFGLDYGELDILRDGDDGRIYIVDVNNTPSGPPNHISRAEYKKAIQLLSSSFESEFIKGDG
jgi:hypothetical protein